MSTFTASALSQIQGAHQNDVGIQWGVFHHLENGDEPYFACIYKTDRTLNSEGIPWETIKAYHYSSQERAVEAARSWYAVAQAYINKGCKMYVFIAGSSPETETEPSSNEEETAQFLEEHAIEVDDKPNRGLFRMIRSENSVRV